MEDASGRPSSSSFTGARVETILAGLEIDYPEKREERGVGGEGSVTGASEGLAHHGAREETPGDL